MAAAKQAHVCDRDHSSEVSHPCKVIREACFLGQDSAKLCWTAFRFRRTMERRKKH
jgi:hypothetical protein